MKLLIETIRNYGLLKTAYFAIRELKYILVNRLIYGSYSQNYEDLEIYRILGKDKIFYVDVGCHEPHRLNNTYFFYKRGSRGVNIDANPQAIASFTKVRPDDRCLNVGVSSVAGTLTLKMFSAPALNTFDAVAADSYVKSGHKVVGEVKVEVKPLSEILASCGATGEIDLLSVDVEGMDLQVLRSLDFDRYKPRVICVEKTNNCYLEIAELLASKSYRLVFENSVNAIYLIQLTN